MTKHGMKKVDGSWFALLDVEDLDTAGWKIGDLGPRFHQAFNS